MCANINDVGRIKYVDLVKVFAIFCVLWGHSMQCMSIDDFRNNNVAMFIYSFHMPLFMMLSGFFFLPSLKLNIFKFVIKKMQQLILPIFTWAILFQLFNTIYGLKHSEFVPLSVFIKNVYIYIDLNLWFLKSLFSCYLVAYISIKVFKRKRLACMISLCFFLLIFPRIFQLGYMLPFFWLGILIKERFYFIDKYSIAISIGTFFIFVVLLFLWKGDYLIYYCKIPSLFEYNINTYKYDISVALLRFGIGAVGAVFFILLIRTIYVYTSKISDKVTIVGKFTLGIYIIQEYLFGILGRFKFYEGNKIIYNLVETPILALIVLIFSSSTVFFLSRNRYTNLFLLGNKLKLK